MKTAFRQFKNTSEFPNDWARPVCEWIAARYGLSNVALVIRRGVQRSGCGRAWPNSGYATMTIARRDFRRSWKYATISWAKDYRVTSPLESFVFLAAHELHHLSTEYRTFKRDAKARSGHWRQLMEQATDRRAWEVVEAYRAEARSFLKLYLSRLRRQRRKIVTEKMRAAQSKTPEARISKIEYRLAEWERRLIQAQRFVKKYRTKLNRTAAAMRRRALATSSPVLFSKRHVPEPPSAPG